jgi:polysaccharide biosynthesis protein PelA
MLLTGFSFFGLRSKPAAPIESLHSVKTYTIYYGPPTASAMERLKRVDLAILESLAFSREQLAELRQAGTMLLGYVSVMESAVWNEARMQRLEPAFYLQQQGKERIHFPEWNSYLMDLREEGYRQVLQQEIEEIIRGKGMQGIFLDTVGDIDEYVTGAAVKQELRAAYRTFLQQLHVRYPSMAILQNRGFDTLDAAVPYIQGFLWEDFRPDWQHNDWMKQQVQRLSKEQQRGLKVFSVSLSKDKRNVKEARRLRFVHFDCPGSYHEEVH